MFRLSIQLSFLLFFLVISLFVKGEQIDSLKNYHHKKLNNSTLKIYAENGLITLTAIKANVIKVDYAESESDSVAEKFTPSKVIIRVTQNLDDIFMFTDSLIIIINKLDFSIKFEKRNEEVLLVNRQTYFKKKSIETYFSTYDEVFYNEKSELLKIKKFKIKQSKAIYSSRKYVLLMPNQKNSSAFIISKFFVKYSNKGSALCYFFEFSDGVFVRQLMKNISN